MINFPDQPIEGDTYAAGDTLWVYDGGVWVTSFYGGADYGTVDGGMPFFSFNVVLDNGVSISQFVDNSPVNGGSP
jgi:hypothetical protein